jgi:retinol dehydrogenase-12
MSSRSKQQPVIFNCVNPGFCRSELLRDVNTISLKLMMLLLARTTEAGSRQLVWAAVGLPESGSLDELRGTYISRASVEEPSDFVLGEEGKKREDKIFVRPKPRSSI